MMLGIFRKPGREYQEVLEGSDSQKKRYPRVVIQKDAVRVVAQSGGTFVVEKRFDTKDALGEPGMGWLSYHTITKGAKSYDRSLTDDVALLLLEELDRLK